MRLLKQFLVVAAVAFAAWFFFIRGSHGRIGETNPTRIVAIGDSLTAGFPGDNLGEHWPEILGRRLNAKVINLSHPGDTLEEARNRWSNPVRTLKWMEKDPAWKPELIIVVLGGNDIKQNAGRASVEKGLDAWAAQLKRSDAKVLFVAVPGGLLNDAYAGAWKKIAAQNGFEIMDESTLRHIFLTASLTVEDHIHMNAAGQKYFADAVYDRITGGG